MWTSTTVITAFSAMMTAKEVAALDSMRCKVTWSSILGAEARILPLRWQFLRCRSGILCTLGFNGTWAHGTHLSFRLFWRYRFTALKHAMSFMDL